MPKGEDNYLQNLKKEIESLEEYLQNPKKINNKIYLAKKGQILAKYLQFIAPYVGVSIVTIIILKLITKEKKLW